MLLQRWIDRLVARRDGPVLVSITYLVINRNSLKGTPCARCPSFKNGHGSIYLLLGNLKNLLQSLFSDDIGNARQWTAYQRQRRSRSRDLLDVEHRNRLFNGDYGPG